MGDLVITESPGEVLILKELSDTENLGTLISNLQLEEFEFGCLGRPASAPQMSHVLSCSALSLLGILGVF